MRDELYCMGCEHAEDDCAICDLCANAHTIVADQEVIPVPLDDGCRWVQPKPAAQ